MEEDNTPATGKYDAKQPYPVSSCSRLKTVKLQLVRKLAETNQLDDRDEILFLHLLGFPYNAQEAACGFNL